ncbi:UbiA family prenyltransferase [Thermoflexibacter ruber]|uniref:1,4-dihydroxy-2-naphthoate octaprenyltransferase n=1 Tax=Thermoflexibacter ruber TaxID=1003 RepID=A0A1I2K2V4_9BACT|nr:UbiA family prenyltransferase [Thermoflexibacter ruber]SFF60668.1 1,4-dihydroxy-2-naphthoate octaprenyltransferase [Thermoflexibacter ruber]
MWSTSTWQHLRLPFSFFLLPIYLFALSVSPQIDWGKASLAFIALHLFIYPASNGFNSYYDKDEKSIGGVEKPLPVSNELLNASLIFDLIGLNIGFLAGWEFALALFIYGLASKGYSHPAIRLKKYPIISLLTIAFFQGAFTFLATYQVVNQVPIKQLTENPILLPACLSSLMLLGSYPMTQIYQHEEDSKRGDKTMSLLLGIQGTFIYTISVFGLATAGFAYFYYTYFSLLSAISFLVALSPVLLFFFSWFLKTLKNEQEANFKNTMRLNMISAICLNVFYIIFYFCVQY